MSSAGIYSKFQEEECKSNIKFRRTMKINSENSNREKIAIAQKVK